MTAFAIARVILVEFDIADQVEVCVFFPDVVNLDVTVCTAVV
jgi:hypothetical protein